MQKIKYEKYKYKNTNSHMNRLELTEMHELNVPRDPCNPSPNYNFVECIKDFVTTQVSQMKVFNKQKPQIQRQTQPRLLGATVLTVALCAALVII